MINRINTHPTEMLDEDVEIDRGRIGVLQSRDLFAVNEDSRDQLFLSILLSELGERHALVRDHLRPVVIELLFEFVQFSPGFGLGLAVTLFLYALAGDWIGERDAADVTPAGLVIIDVASSLFHISPKIEGYTFAYTYD